MDSPSPLPSGSLIERPKSYDELLARPAFRQVLDKTKHALRQVLSDYHFSQLVPCGLSDCKTPHRHGFLVQTDGDHETNVGHVCGRNAFGDDFDIKRATYQRQRDRQDVLSRAAAITSQAADIKRRIAELNSAPFGIRWVRDVKAALRDVIGDALIQSLQAAQKQQNLEVTEAVERSAAEIDRIVERTHQRRDLVRYETRRLGLLEPMPWLTFDFGRTLQEGLLVPLEAFCAMPHREVPTSRLRQAVKQFDGWEKTVEDASEAAMSAVRFFTRENIELLSLWVPDHMVSRRRAVKSWIDSKPYRTLSMGRIPEKAAQGNVTVPRGPSADTRA